MLKIDVEGSELGVFRGAVGLLEAHHPTLIFESEIEEHREEINALLLLLGYRFYSSELPPSRRVRLPGITGNALAIPS